MSGEVEWSLYLIHQALRMQQLTCWSPETNQSATAMLTSACYSIAPWRATAHLLFPLMVVEKEK